VSTFGKRRRSTVVFLDGGLFGYSEGGRTHVLRLPE